MTKMNFIQNARLLISVASLLAASNSWPIEMYSVNDLGVVVDLPGRSDSRPNAINRNGEIAGANVTNGAYRAMVYARGWVNIGTLGGGESLASGINDSGRTVGGSLTTNGLQRAFLWTQDSTNGVPGNPQMQDLGTLGGNHSEAYDINNSGQITGYAQTPEGEHVFRYSAGVMTDIGALLNGLPYSFGYSINDAGHIAGTAYDATYATPHAFFYNGSTAVDIGNLGGQGSSALAINNSDHIVGYVTTSNGVDRAFHYVSGVMTNLGTLGGDYSYANAINNNNVIVGGSFTDTRNTIFHAFISVSNSLVDLNNQLDDTGVGWTLIEARAINDSGQIVGVGMYGGGNRAFLLTPSLKISAISLAGSNVLIRFATVTGATYFLEASATLLSGSWSNLTAGVAGTGNLVTVTNVGAATLPHRFYRVRRSVP